MEARKKEEVNVLQFVRTWNKTTRKNIAFLVVLVQGMVYNNPYTYICINPTIQLLAFVELSAMIVPPLI